MMRRNTLMNSMLIGLPFSSTGGGPKDSIAIMGMTIKKVSAENVIDTVKAVRCGAIRVILLVTVSPARLVYITGWR